MPIVTPPSACRLLENLRFPTEIAVYLDPYYHIERVRLTTSLGIYLDSNLSWLSHVEATVILLLETIEV